MSLALAAVAATTSSQAATTQQSADAALAQICGTLDRTTDPTPIEVHDLATCYYLGNGRPRDFARARILYAQAAERGFPRAMCALGNMLIAGEGGEREIERGLALCRRAAEAGEAQAQTDLGGYLLTGEVIPKDAAEARRWLALAAEQRQANAAFLLGQIYWNGDGIAKDNAAAARWWRVAHEGGRPDAAYLLAREAFVRITRGVADPREANPEVVAEAIRWFEIARDSDPTPANREDAARMAGDLRQFLAMLQRRRG